VTAIFLGLGSNIEPGRYLPLGISRLELLLGPLRLSPVYEGAAIGFAGSPFWNLVVSADTALAVGELQQALREIEYAHGRPANATRFSARALDIDILTFGDLCGVVDGVVLPRGEIVQNAFVLRPLAELAPEAVHPVLGQSYRELWDAYDQLSQPLQSVSLNLDSSRS
jgi:2-amino-4-hydroxy-6-hydroxymethyldihydropteridine diphosphokinase